MNSLTIVNIKSLVNTRLSWQKLRGKDLSSLPLINNAYLTVEGDTIAAYGPMSDWKKQAIDERYVFDATDRMVLPCWCDSHTHLVYVGSREEEFVSKIRGMTYGEINKKRGGILQSAKWVQQATEDQLFQEAWQRLVEVSKLGTGAIEIKSGYGLSTEAELKMLRVIKMLKQRSTLTIKSTFLGAHRYPPEFENNHQGYIDRLIDEMLPVIADEKLADFVDVFCDVGFFDATEAATICAAGQRLGIKSKLHTNQLSSIGGIQTGIKVNAISMDHLEILSDQEISLLCDGWDQEASSGWSGVCTLLPTAAFFLGAPFQPARKLIDRGACVALASDCNPGSSPSGNMNLVVSMSCIGMKMLPEEAINAATINGAFAMDLADQVGSISVGKKANLIITRPVPSLAYLPYSFGSNLIERVMVSGSFIS